MTPKRLELLQAIADGQVIHFVPMGRAAEYDRRRGAGLVTATMQAFSKAGLAELARHRLGVSTFAPRPWVLTPSGESVLASHREASG